MNMNLKGKLKLWSNDITAFVKDGLGLELSPAQETLLRSIYALPLSPPQLEIYRQCTGRTNPPQKPFSEVTVIAGARAGKDSRIAGPVALYEAIFGGHAEQLARGERGIIPIVAADARGTKIAFGYLKGYLTSSPILSTMIEEVYAAEIALTNRISIVCFPCVGKSLRGWSIPAGILDEVGFYRLEGSSDSDAEVQASVRRGMIGFKQSRLVKISTPYMKGGVLYDDYKIAFGVDHPDLLVWKASSVLMNPTLEGRLEQEKRLDPLRYQREYEAEFADDIAAFLPSKWIEDAVVSGRHELPFNPSFIYSSACDPSGGGADAFTFSIVHTEGQGPESKTVQDVLKGWQRVGNEAPDLKGVVKEICDILRAYSLTSIVGDRYAGQWVRQAFSENGISYQESESDKSAAYLSLEPQFAQGRIELLDHPRMVRELKTLERRPRSGGKIIVDHPLRFHDDYSNALALAVSVTGKYGLEVAKGFSRLFHVAPGRIKPVPNVPLIIAQSFGLSPVTLIGQANRGYIYVHAVLICEGSLRQHYDNNVYPWFQRAAPWAIGDPALIVGRYDKEGLTIESGEANPAWAVQDMLPGNWWPGPDQWEAKLGLLFAGLQKHVKPGEPALQIDPVDAKPLAEALDGRWHYKAGQDKALDNHPWSDIGSGFCLFLSSASSGIAPSNKELKVESDFNVFESLNFGL
jgi:hypothetical protein